MGKICEMLHNSKKCNHGRDDDGRDYVGRDNVVRNEVGRDDVGIGYKKIGRVLRTFPICWRRFNA